MWVAIISDVPWFYVCFGLFGNHMKLFAEMLVLLA